MDLHSAHPYWFVKNGLLATYPPVEQDIKCDVLIIGGGISGAFTAARLTEEGRDVVVVDSREFGLGSTCASTCLLMYELDSHLLDLRESRGRKTADTAYKTCHDALADLPAWMEKAGGAYNCQFRQKQSLYIASRKRDEKALRAECEARQSIGIDCRLMESDEIEAKFPFTAPVAILSPHAAEADAYRLNHGLLSYAAEKGLRAFDRTKIETVQEDETGVSAKTSDGFTIRASHIVFAAGYESGRYLRISVQDNRSTFALVSEPVANLDPWWDEVHIWESARPYLYMRTTPDSRIIMGGEDEKFRDPPRRDALIPRKTHKLEKRFEQMFPDMPMKTSFAWAGTFAETKNSLPRIGKCDEWKRAYFALGFGGNGITFSMIAAEIIAGDITGKPVPYASAFGFIEC